MNNPDSKKLAAMVQAAVADALKNQPASRYWLDDSPAPQTKRGRKVAPVAPPPRRTLDELIMELVEQRPHTESDLRAALGYDPKDRSAVNDAVRRLKKQGLVIVIPDGSGPQIRHYVFDAGMKDPFAWFLEHTGKRRVRRS